MSGDVTHSDLTAFAGTECLVTGGLGFIGSNLAVALTAAGARVCVVDALVPGHGGNRHNVTDDAGAPLPIEVIEADLCDTGAYAAAAARAQYVFNLAGQVSHQSSMDDPVRDLDLNTRGQFAFVDHLRRHNRDAVVVYTSTRQVYGRSRYTPVDEAHPVQPVDVNGIDKLAAESFHLLYHRVHGMRTVVLRLSNVYGPRQQLQGETQGFLGIFLRQALDGEKIQVWGDGTQRRDCTHVDDVIPALVAAALNPAASGEIVNIGTPIGLELRSIAETVVATAGTGSVELVDFPAERATIDIGTFQIDIDKAKRLFGWEPSIDFDDGIASTIDFYRTRLQWYR